MAQRGGDTRARLRGATANAHGAVERAVRHLAHQIGRFVDGLRDMGELEADIASLAHFEKLSISGHEIARDPAFPSMNKTINSELVQRASTIMSQVSGVDALARQLEALRVGSNVEPLGSEFDLISMPLYLNSRATTIYAGSNEVQRDLIARTI